MKFLAMHITNQEVSFDIFTVRNLVNIFMEHDLNILMIFGIKENLIILTHTMYFVYCYNIYIYIYAFSRRFYPNGLTVHSGYTCFINIPQRFKTVLQGCN